jgi:hypothetical protein
MDRVLLTIKVMLLMFIAHTLIGVINPIWWINTILWFAAAELLFVAYQIVMSMFARPVPPTKTPEMNRN